MHNFKKIPESQHSSVTKKCTCKELFLKKLKNLGLRHIFEEKHVFWKTFIIKLLFTFVVHLPNTLFPSKTLMYVASKPAFKGAESRDFL